MQVQSNSNVSFGGIRRIIVKPKIFNNPGNDILKYSVRPYVDVFMDKYRIFVGGPKFPSYLNEAGLDEVVIRNKNGEEIGKKTEVRLIGDVKNYLKKRNRSVPKYFSSDEAQPLYIVTGQEDVNAVDNFMARLEGRDKVNRLRYGAFAEFLENALAFEAHFAKKIEELTFTELNSTLKFFRTCSKAKN